jgi:hypothetical protein
MFSNPWSLAVVVIIWGLLALVFVVALAYAAGRPRPKFGADQEVASKENEVQGQSTGKAQEQCAPLVVGDGPAGQDNETSN